MDYTVKLHKAKLVLSVTALYIDKKMNCKRTSTPNGSMDTHTSYLLREWLNRVSSNPCQGPSKVCKHEFQSPCPSFRGIELRFY